MADGFNIRSGTSIINNSTNTLNKNIKSIEGAFLTELRKEIAKLGTKAGGVVSDNKRNRKILNELRARIRGILQKIGYFDYVNNFLLDFNELESFQKFIHKQQNNINLKKKTLNPYKKWAIDKVAYDLNGVGLDALLIQPIRDEMRKAVNLGGSFIDLLDGVTGLVESDTKMGLLRSTVFQASRDSMGQYNGIVNEAIRKEYNLNAFRYIGSVIEDTRPQCIRWTGMGVLFFDDLQKEINWAKRNGTGFIKETTPDSFAQNRGGYNCRHTAIPVRREKK